MNKWLRAVALCDTRTQRTVSLCWSAPFLATTTTTTCNHLTLDNFHYANLFLRVPFTRCTNLHSLSCQVEFYGVAQLNIKWKEGEEA